MTPPFPPGSPTQSASAQQIGDWISQFGEWLADQRLQLDRIDQRVRQIDPARGVQDMAMVLTVWQTLQTRQLDLLRLWDSGRLTTMDLTRVNELIWSDVNDDLAPGSSLGGKGGLSVNTAEASRMLVALIDQLTSRFQLAPRNNAHTARLIGLQAQLQRIKQQSGLDPEPIQTAHQGAIAALTKQIDQLTNLASQGGDLGGCLGPVEAGATRLERDLIVDHAQRQLFSQRLHTDQLRFHEAIARCRRVKDLAAHTQSQVTPAPRYAVPQVERLGPPPQEVTALDAWEAHLGRVEQALTVVDSANRQALAASQQLLKRFNQTKPGSALTNDLRQQAAQLIEHRPINAAVLTALIQAIEASEVN
ncbi:MAG: hypothetical protein LBV30_09005 [Propionibacteriaceae bacterium]|jgi:hypothetical protein|nr:hypothetical protein [Propionibacteriaceae bacterium]